MTFKNFGPLGLLLVSFIALLAFSEAKPENEAAAVVAAAPLSQAGGLKEPLALVEAGPAKTRVARRGGYYGGGMGGRGGARRFSGARRYRGHHQRFRGRGHSRGSYGRY